jgi:hypothetical protein
MRKVGVYLADTHGGHKLCLLNPETQLPEEDQSTGEIYWYRPQLTRMQEYLWNKYEEHRAAVWELADGDPVHVFHVGDECHGRKYPNQLVSTRLADQILIAEANLGVWLYEGCASLRLGKGTSAHDFGEGSSTVILTNNFSKQYPDIDTKIIMHGVANFDGCRVDYAHHGPVPGGRKWLEGNVVRYYVRDKMMQDILYKVEPCQLFIRAHYHKAVHEVVEVIGHRRWTAEAWILPCYSGLSDYARQRVHSPDRVHIGLIAFVIEDGCLVETVPLVETLDLRQEEYF